MLRERIPVRAFIHITGDGLLNLARIDAPVGFEIETLPPVPPLFTLLQQLGGISPRRVRLRPPPGKARDVKWPVSQRDWCHRAVMMSALDTTPALDRGARDARVAVLIPCYNEARTIGTVVRRFREVLPAAAIYVFDNLGHGQSFPPRARSA